MRTHGYLRRHLAIAATLLGGGMFAAAAPADPPPALQRAEMAVLPERPGHGETAFRARDRRRSPQPRLIDIGAPAREETQALAAIFPRAGVPRQIGFSRSIGRLATVEATASHLSWQQTAEGGWIAALGFSSGSALGIRLGILVRQLPSDAVVRTFASGADQAIEVSGQQILATIRRNHAAGDASDEANTWWTPLISGQDVTLEIDLPQGSAPDQVQIAIPRLAHQFATAFAASRSVFWPPATGGAASCELDASCYPAWSNERNATALLVFVNSGIEYVCSGTLLNSIPTTSIPYFLTANHCISSQTSASSLNTFWFWQSASCGSGSINPSYQQRVNGALLLYNTTTTDTSFLQLSDAPPAGATYAGWDPSPPTLSTQVTGIHHPKGDLQKISFGDLNAYENCTATNGSGTYSCNDLPTPANAGFLSVFFQSGITEGGSSGSGIFEASNGSHYLIGQLRGGASSCSNPNGGNDYGRFDLAYGAALHTWLSPSALHTDIREYVPSAALTGGYESFVRAINTGSAATPLSVARIDPVSGAVGASGQLTASLPAGAAMTFSARQIETALGTMLGAADRPRLRMTFNATTTLQFQSFLLQPGGAYNEVSSALGGGSGVQVRTYVPAAALASGYESFLRIINTGSAATSITVARIDPVTGLTGNAATLNASLPAGAAMTYTAGDIEQALGNMAAGDRPRIQVIAASSTIDVQSYLLQPGSAFSEVSSGQGANSYENTASGGASIEVRSYLPALSPTYTSYLRIINGSSVATAVTATLLDDTTGSAGASATIISSLPGNAATTLSSAQIEAALGVTLAPTSRPRLRIAAPSATLRVQSFVLQPNGTFNEISNAVRGTSVMVSTYVPAIEAASGYASSVRVINTGSGPTPVSVALIDPASGGTGSPALLAVTLPAGGAQMFTSSQIEAALGTPIAAGTRPRLLINGNGSNVIEVQSFLTQPGLGYAEVSGSQ